MRCGGQLALHVSRMTSYISLIVSEGLNIFKALQGTLVGELCSGWVASVERRVGLFASLPAQTANAQADSAKRPATGNPSLRPALTLEQYAEGVESHCIWLVLLQEAWHVRIAAQHSPLSLWFFLLILACMHCRSSLSIVSVVFLFVVSKVVSGSTMLSVCAS